MTQAACAHPAPAAPLFSEGSAPAFLQGDLAMVDTTIHNALQSQSPLLGQITRHIVQGSGKRIRPLLVLACARLLGYQGKDHIPLAASIELIHTATLLHDDVIDDSPVRRGRPAAHTLWGEKAAILGGDFLFAQAFHLMMQSRSMGAMDILAQATSALVEGEMLQLEHFHSLDRTLADYEQVMAAKTGALFQAACHVAALVAGASPGETAALVRYGAFLGLLFQTRDDWLDYTPEHPARLPRAADLREGKVTLPVLLCFQQADTETQDEIRTLFSPHLPCPEAGSAPLHIRLNRLQVLFQHTGVAESVQSQMQHYARHCHQALTCLPETPARTHLEHLVCALTVPPT